MPDEPIAEAPPEEELRPDLNEDILVGTVPIELIHSGERARDDYGNLQELVASIQKNGLIQSLAVLAVGDHFEIIAGERRLRACRLAGLQKVPVRIYSEIDEWQTKVIELEENLVRKDFTWPEEVKMKEQIHKLYEEKHGRNLAANGKGTGWTKDKTAQKLGESAANLGSDLALARALAAAPELASLKSKADAKKLIKQVGDQHQRKQQVAEIKRVGAEAGLHAQKTSLENSYIVGDFFAHCKKLPAGHYDICEIDPPYGIDLHKLRDTSSMEMAEYVEVDADKYVNFLNKLCEEAYRLMKEDSWLIFWFGWSWFEEVLEAIEGAGFSVREVPALWTKKQGVTMAPQVYLGSACEPFFYARKGKPTIKKQGHLNLFTHAGVPPQARRHPTQRPLPLMQEVLETFATPGARVLVPFAGSGSTLLAASNLLMTGTAFDLSQDFKDNFSLAVLQGSLGQYMD